MSETYDVIVIGAGAAGFMCAIEAGKRGRRVWLIDHSKKIAEKIRISGGGRCNFTNLHTKPENYLSNNPHFCKSALRQYTQHDFINWVENHAIGYHEKTLGQLFCDDSATNIIDMLVKEAKQNGVQLDMETEVNSVTKTATGFAVDTSRGVAHSGSLVIATGGLSIPKIGATKFGYDIAQQFGLNILDRRAALVPLTFQSEILELCQALSGLSVEATVHCKKMNFSEGMLFTHRGLSGPSILQISSYWSEGHTIEINLAPEVEVKEWLLEQKKLNAKQNVPNIISEILPKRLAQALCSQQNLSDRIAETPDKKLAVLASSINHWEISPAGSEGYRTAEVTLGGVDTNELSSKTMEANKQKGLFFIGEVVDVTGHLGGYNFQWAWSSGFAAGQNV